ncbi:class I SAM-dependent methyltransferase [Nocardia sp. NPDC127579]|uniref:class I SAM-dependent methyltransferase n=1 Tax=Nocardia sp. NPDC127579 TaxID=3345402 RepID=UPI003625EE16
MPILSPEPASSQGMAQSFGVDAPRYDRARPAYPAALITAIRTGSPGPDLLDIGCGTGIAARQFQAAGCTVLGVEPDARMAEYARDRGLDVEVATFETWQPGTRTFDTIIAAQSWHWVDATTGPTKAAELLRPGGRLAIFGHVYEPPDAVAAPFAAAFAQAAPDSPLSTQPARRPLELYRAGYTAFADQLRATGRFDEPHLWQFDWQRPYTRDEWLALLPTTGGLTRLRPEQLTVVLDAVGAAIDALGGSFTMEYTTLATTAVRR